MTMQDYQPARVESIQMTNPSKIDSISDTLSFITWNIGYAGLGKEQDFFFDGGQMVRPTEELSKKYFNGIIEEIKTFSTDFIFLQEVDLYSKRSYYKNQVQQIESVKESYTSCFAINYNSIFVPTPITNPYGKCKGGIQVLSKYKPTSSSRYALADDASWPNGLFMLKRCYVELRYPLKNGKELIVINHHLSAFDDGTVRQQQMDTMKVKLLEEYKKGNYVICGGDWNQYPPGYQPNIKNDEKLVNFNVDKSYPQEGWIWAFDVTTTTNRKLSSPYIKGTTDEVVIDFFLLSPNVKLIEVKGIDLGFENSDHNPVQMKISIP